MGATGWEGHLHLTIWNSLALMPLRCMEHLAYCMQCAICSPYFKPEVHHFGGQFPAGESKCWQNSFCILGPALVLRISNIQCINAFFFLMPIYKKLFGTTICSYAQI